MAFLSSAVLEFFAAISIAMMAVYLGFSLLGHLDFGYYESRPDLALAFFILLLAPEFYLPLRELGTHYHARAEALAAAEQLQPIFQASSPVLHDLSLDLAVGGSLAIVGASGAGKTTLLRLILGELTTQQGDILVDGQALGELDAQAWREGIAWMSQHPRLLPASLADNLRVARHDADEAAMYEALAFAELLPWFESLPDGWATQLGEGGRLLSGGQLRRLALARVHLRNARLLLLDEPTASLDTETEALVMAGLQRLAKGRTLLLLTHRRAALQLVARVALLDGGRIVAHGQPEKVPEIDNFLAGESA
jgi:ATP-binding cassette subfamily C protein CydD